MSDLIFGKYEVIRRIALGGMGEVFLARQTGVAGFDRLVILKSLLPELAEQEGFIDQFLDEARVAATLNHPNIVAIYEVGLWNGVYFIAMEFIHGCDLSKLQKSAAKAKLVLPFQVSARIIHDACMGLAHAHEAADMAGHRLNIVHRDVSPQNIMVRGDGVTKVVDFGIALANNRSTRTATGMLKGKLQYMPPEQLQGEDLDGRSDQFALGVVLWEMCTGQRLFKADNELKVLEKILKEPVPAPQTLVPGFPSDLEDVIMRMLARDPAARYPSCADAAAGLKTYLEASSRMIGEQQVATFVQTAMGDELEKVTSDLTPAQGNFMLSLGSNPMLQLGDTPATSVTSMRRTKTKSRVALAAGLAMAAVVATLAVAAVMWGDGGQTVAISDIPDDDGHLRTPSDKADNGKTQATSTQHRVRKKRGKRGQTILDIPEPVGALVYVDGKKWKQKVPTSISGLSAGNHSIVVEFEGKKLPAEQVQVVAQAPVLRLTSTPKGAAVMLAGTMVGMTPFEISTLQPGEYDLEVSLRGYGKKKVHVTLASGLVARKLTLTRLKPSRSGRRTQRRASQPPPPQERIVIQKEQFGYITIATKPWAKISLDGSPIGSTPIFKRRVKVGSHTVRLLNEEAGINTRRKVTVKSGQVVKKNWRLK